MVFYLDDGTIGGCFEDVLDDRDLKLIEEESKDLGLHLNMNLSASMNTPCRHPHPPSMVYN